MDRRSFTLSTGFPLSRRAHEICCLIPLSQPNQRGRVHCFLANRTGFHSIPHVVTAQEEERRHQYLKFVGCFLCQENRRCKFLLDSFVDDYRQCDVPRRSSTKYDLIFEFVARAEVCMVRYQLGIRDWVFKQHHYTGWDQHF